jgi:hypothetical protein
MTNYTESKKQIEVIRREYTTAGDVLFRTAIQMLVEQGQENFKDAEWYAAAVKSINDRHDEVEREGKIAIIGRRFELNILECAKKLAEIEIYDLLIYIQREVYWSNEGIDYQRAIELLKGCMSLIMGDRELDYVRDDFLDYIGFEEDELDSLGYGFLVEDDE